MKTNKEIVEATNKESGSSLAQQSKQLSNRNGAAKTARNIYLFSQDQLAYSFHNLFNLNELFCNVYLVCQLTKDQDSMLAKYNNIWAIDVFKSCPMMLKNINYEKCLLDERIGSCGKNHVIVENFFADNELFNSFFIFSFIISKTLKGI